MFEQPWQEQSGPIVSGSLPRRRVGKCRRQDDSCSGVAAGQPHDRRRNCFLIVGEVNAGVAASVRPFCQLLWRPAQRFIEMAKIAGVRLAQSSAAGNVRDLNAVRPVGCEQRVHLIGHVTVVTQASGRIGGVPRVFNEALAIAAVALIASLVRLHFWLEQEIWIVAVHRVTRQATQFSLALLVTGRDAIPLYSSAVVSGVPSPQNRPSIGAACAVGRRTPASLACSSSDQKKVL